MSTVSPDDLISEYAKYLRRRRRAASTIDHYVAILRRMDEDLPEGLEDSTTEEIADWIFEGNDGGARTEDHYITVINGFGKWATNVAEPYTFNPAALLERPTVRKRKKRPAPEGVFAQLLARAQMPMVLALELAGYGGLRCCEISRLDREDVDERETRLVGKGDKERTIPTHPVVWRRVKDMPAGALIRGRDGERLTASEISKRGWRLMHGYGHSMHSLRRRFATRAYDVNRDILAVQELLGHAQVTTTEQYLTVNRDRMAAAVDGLPVAAVSG
jgi:integrase/recombinase XerC